MSHHHRHCLVQLTTGPEDKRMCTCAAYGHTPTGADLGEKDEGADLGEKDEGADLGEKDEGAQPETQLGVDLIRAEAALARVRALHTNPHFCSTVVYAEGNYDETELWIGAQQCATIRALDGAP